MMYFLLFLINVGKYCGFFNLEEKNYLIIMINIVGEVKVEFVWCYIECYLGL